jgi:HK97 family phage major capsid protein
MSILKPPSVSSALRLKSSRQWLQEADKLLSESIQNNSFNRENQAKFESILAMVHAGQLNSYDRGIYNRELRAVNATRVIDPAALDFFSGKSSPDRMVSERGSELQEQIDARIGGKAVGSVTEFRDCSYGLSAEARTYAGLNEGTGAQGGFTVPIGFWPEILFALRQIDGLWNSAKLVITPTGGPLNLPTAFETNSGRQLSEAALVSQTNPTFGNVHWSNCPLWSSDQILTSVALAEDCGAPNMVEAMKQIFAIRISVGLGGQFTGTLLSNAHVGVTTASPTAITPAEVMELPTALSNAAYGYKPTSGWLMSAATLEYVYALVGTDGLRIFPKKFSDDTGLPLLLEQPVYLSPSMGAIGASAKPIAFGDLSRFWIRQVGDTFSILRYNELYMANFQFGWQAWLFADGQLVSADGGASDWPIVLLQMHS